MLFLKINSDDQNELAPQQEHEHNTARGKTLLQTFFLLKKTMHETVLRHIKIMEESYKMDCSSEKKL